mmetsp:Transcript_7732/g.15546  ORF Transcript_7732/g.15546 Transcript_7732/m.15546 type:complete len:588 (-) Transcript_7732:630-2393(-)
MNTRSCCSNGVRMMLPIGRLCHRGLSMRKGIRCHLVGSLMQKGQEKMLYADYELGEVLPETYENIEPAGSKQRRAGVVLHPTSLPGKYGTGEIGNEALKFIDWLVDAGMQVWQVLPLVPPDPLYWSPYSGEDALCGNTLLIPLEGLVHMGLLEKEDIQQLDRVQTVDGNAAFDEAIKIKTPLLVKAAMALLDKPEFEGLRSACDSFRAKNPWVEESALFHALCEDPDLAEYEAWWDWPANVRDRHPRTLANLRALWSDKIEVFVVLQFLFDKFWSGVRDYASARGVTIVGDMPIYVGGHSADVWANRKLFQLDRETGTPSLVSGVPPDAFSSTGQLWGSPLYDWKANEAEGYSWWIQRMKRAMELYDETRIDHFRAFAGYWAVEAWRDTAMVGQWQKGPGLALFNALRRELGEVPILAEDLGVITADVIELRDLVGAPGMLVLQFAWGGGPRNTHLPHNARPNSFIYTGTHDNPTTVEWWETQATDEEKQIIHEYCGIDIAEGDIVAAFTKLAFASVSKTAIITMQDALRLGAEARMNTPGRAEGNWAWRLDDSEEVWKSEKLTAAAAELREWVTVTDRLSDLHITD